MSSIGEIPVEEADFGDAGGTRVAPGVAPAGLADVLALRRPESYLWHLTETRHVLFPRECPESPPPVKTSEEPPAGRKGSANFKPPYVAPAGSEEPDRLPMGVDLADLPGAFGRPPLSEAVPGVKKAAAVARGGVREDADAATGVSHVGRAAKLLKNKDKDKHKGVGQHSKSPGSRGDSGGSTSSLGHGHVRQKRVRDPSMVRCTKCVWRSVYKQRWQIFA